MTYRGLESRLEELVEGGLADALEVVLPVALEEARHVGEVVVAEHVLLVDAVEPH